MNRALRAATMGVLLLSPVALSACSAGQVTQTASQQRDKVGTLAEVGDITLRAVTVAYPEDGVYQAGDDAPLQMAIVNAANEDDTLTDISGQGFDGVEISTGDSGTSAGSDELEIPARSTVFVGAEVGPEITLTGLDESLTAGEFVELVLTFENAGEVPLRVSVDTPDEVVERGEEFDFHHQEEHGTGEQAPQEQVEVSGGAHN